MCKKGCTFLRNPMLLYWEIQLLPAAKRTHVKQFLFFCRLHTQHNKRTPCVMKHEILGLVTTITTKKGLQLQFDISFGTSLKVKGLGKRFVLV